MILPLNKNEEDPMQIYLESITQINSHWCKPAVATLKRPKKRYIVTDEYVENINFLISRHGGYDPQQLDSISNMDKFC